MISASWDRARHLRTAARVLAVLAVAACVLVLAVGMSLPETWWPRTGQAFAADTSPAHEDSCGLIVGPAKAYCERGSTHFKAVAPHDAAGAAWRLVPAGTGLAALAVWRRRSAAGRRRR
ncbi:hypothetical protein OHB05_42435 [Streptomyces sp. NBC_00638]|uniref:hypothetical protein n=1 Tax=Streptomyces sp. NBC_00638 TaxID=2975794 RepID=UPI00225C08FD|nr:hypothetical protein [Streptomyces sp. NBC_00638]MCX5009177.1 hypothetical protein [Streptomyces sp. NBC_00638]